MTAPTPPPPDASPAELAKYPAELAKYSAEVSFQAALPPMPAGGAGRPAARVTDPHLCPLVDVVKPHVGGPILPPGVPTVLVGGLPAAPGGGNPITCVSVPDATLMGSTTVMVGGRPFVRMGDSTAHGGMIVAGLPTVLIGG